MPKKVTVTKSGLNENGAGIERVKTFIVEDEFDLYEDYYAYQIGAKTDPNGNAVMGAMIGKNNYIRFADVIDISVEDVEEE